MIMAMSASEGLSVPAFWTLMVMNERSSTGVWGDVPVMGGRSRLVGRWFSCVA